MFTCSLVLSNLVNYQMVLFLIDGGLKFLVRLLEVLKIEP